jgi:hypothetical protein
MFKVRADGAHHCRFGFQTAANEAFLEAVCEQLRKHPDCERTSYNRDSGSLELDVHVCMKSAMAPDQLLRCALLEVRRTFVELQAGIAAAVNADTRVPL